MSDRELDARIAQDVMEIPVVWHEYEDVGNRPFYEDSDEGYGPLTEIDFYTTDISAALEAAEKLARDRKCNFALHAWFVEGVAYWSATFKQWDGKAGWDASSDTPTSAICAAIKAVLDQHPRREDEYKTLGGKTVGGTLYGSGTLELPKREEGDNVV